jgi:hypothetical protein
LVGDWGVAEPDEAKEKIEEEGACAGGGGIGRRALPFLLSAPYASRRSISRRSGSSLQPGAGLIEEGLVKVNGRSSPAIAEGIHVVDIVPEPVSRLRE